MNTLDFGNNVLDLSFLNASQEFYVSNLNSRKLDVRLGLRNDIFDIRTINAGQIHGNYDFSQLKNDFVSLFADCRTDTFNDGYFPTRGMNAGLSYSWTFAGFPRHSNPFHTISADIKGVVSIGEIFAVLPSANVRFLLGKEIPAAYFNAIGGSLAGRYVDQQIPFMGVTNLRAMENIMTMARLDMRFRIMKNHYMTGVVNYVRDGDCFKDYLVGPGNLGAGIEYAFDTIFGPLKANIHWSDMTDKVGFYISAGYNF